MNDNEKEKNYNRIVTTIMFLKNNGHISEDWIEEHKSAILFYRDISCDWNLMNIDIQDKNFRESAYKVEIILRYLTKEIKIKKIFSLNIYLELNEHLLSMINYFDTIDDLSNELSKLKM